MKENIICRRDGLRVVVGVRIFGKGDALYLNNNLYGYLFHEYCANAFYVWALERVLTI